MQPVARSYDGCLSGSYVFDRAIYRLAILTKVSKASTELKVHGVQRLHVLEESPFDFILTRDCLEVCDQLCSSLA